VRQALVVLRARDALVMVRTQLISTTRGLVKSMVIAHAARNVVYSPLRRQSGEIVAIPFGAGGNAQPTPSTSTQGVERSASRTRLVFHPAKGRRYGTRRAIMIMSAS
jgi:hypothetical protein